MIGLLGVCVGVAVATAALAGLEYARGSRLVARRAYRDADAHFQRGLRWVALGVPFVIVGWVTLLLLRRIS